MTPHAIALRPNDSLVHAAAVFERTGQPALPVVDDEGNLAGLLLADELPRSTGDAQYTTEFVRDVMNADPVRFAEQTTFNELVNFFSEDPPPWP